MIRYYTIGFDKGDQAIGKTEKKIVNLLLDKLPAHICLINSKSDVFTPFNNEIIFSFIKNFVLFSMPFYFMQAFYQFC